MIVVVSCQESDDDMFRVVGYEYEDCMKTVSLVRPRSLEARAKSMTGDKSGGHTKAYYCCLSDRGT